MSKYLKGLLTQDLSRRLAGVEDCVVVNAIGLAANTAYTLRKQLREKQVQLMVVKNSIARRATEGTPLAAAFDGLDGPAAILWGGDDFVSLVKLVAELDKSEEFAAFKARGGAMAGEALTAERVLEISKWPSRTEQLSLLSGQLLSPGAQLASQLIAVGGALANQIEQIAEGAGKGS